MLSLALYALLLPVLAFEKATFDDVEVKAYSVYTLKFQKTIKSSDSLKENLPRASVFDHLEFTDQNIPVLKENSISDIEDLDELTIDRCRLKEIQPGAFKNLPFLRKLSLKGNQLEKVASGIFNNLQISMVDLSKNWISAIEPSAFDDLPNLLNVNLADNIIAAWNSRWFLNAPLIIRVSLQNNSIEKLPAQAFTNLKGKKKLGSINLIFSYNRISEINQDAFKGLEAINNLWLDNNKLTSFPDNLLEGVDVGDLRIEHNQIACFKGDLGKIIKAETTHMDGNPFDCACLERIKKWSEEHDKDKTVDLFYADMNCRADRLTEKMAALERRLKALSQPREVEELDPKQEDEVEILFK